MAKCFPHRSALHEEPETHTADPAADTTTPSASTRIAAHPILSPFFHPSEHMISAPWVSLL